MPNNITSKQLSKKKTSKQRHHGAKKLFAWFVAKDLRFVLFPNFFPATNEIYFQVTSQIYL